MFAEGLNYELAFFLFPFPFLNYNGTDMNKKIIVFATSNPNKVVEVKERLSPLGYSVICLKDLGLEVTHPEDAETFAGNAKIKAEDIASKCGYPIISDDSGLSIDALDGFPGVHSARFREGHPYSEKNQAILKRREGKENRKAAFHTARVYLDKKKGIEEVFEGIAPGEIVKAFDDKARHGFGYDPIFYSYDLKKTFGQATRQEKDSVSHRGRALKKTFEFIQKLSEEGK